MHVFEHLPISALKKIIREYNLHVSIKGYSKMTHSQLCDIMKKHLMISEDGSIKMMMKDVKDLGKVDDYFPSKTIKPKVLKKPREKKEKVKKVELKPVEEKKVEKVKEMVKKIEEKKEDYNYLESEHAKHAKEYNPLYKKVKTKLDELMPYLETEKLITSRRGQPKTEAEKLSHYFNIEASDSSKNGIEASIRALKHLDKKLDEFKIQKAFHDIKPKNEKKNKK